MKESHTPSSGRETEESEREGENGRETLMDGGRQGCGLS